MSFNLYGQTSVKRFNGVHRWLGLGFAALFYVISLSGTVLAFVEVLERWEQPNIPEFESLSPQASLDAYEAALRKSVAPPETVYVVLPSKAIPRAHASAGDNEWYINQAGELLEAPVEAWVHMLRHLHYYLLLPESFGMIVVGFFGVILVALALSGVLSHPAIIKDAFNLRVFGSRRLAQTDIHNRLSVWGLPFYLMIGITGAFIGLITVFGALAATFYFNGDSHKLFDEVFGPDLQTEQRVQQFNIEPALADLAIRAPNAEPIYLAFQNPGTEQQHLEIAAVLPQRLTYSEIWRYDSAGNYINHQGLADGAVGRQVAYSVYRLHFGQFGEYWVRCLYAVFGLALTVVVASGVNIWLAKRKHEDAINMAWVATVWGLPISLGLAAATAFVYAESAMLSLLVGQVVIFIVAFRLQSWRQLRLWLQRLLVLTLFTLVLMQSLMFWAEAFSGANLYVNAGLLVLAAGVFGMTNVMLKRGV